MAFVLFRRCSEAATCNRFNTSSASPVEDSVPCRVASGRQASCSVSAEWPAFALRDRDQASDGFCGMDSLRPSPSHLPSSQSRHAGLRLLATGKGFRRRSRTEPMGSYTVPGMLRYAGRQGVLLIRGSLGDAEGLPSFSPQRPGPGRSARKVTNLTRASRSSGSSGPSGALQATQCSMTKAFSSMVLMLRTLQSYALQMRSMLYYEDFESVGHVIHREMQASLLWLFQQIFACTPMLMVSVMVLLSDFTAHSASANVLVLEVSPAAIVASAHSFRLSLAEVVSTPLYPREALEADGSGPLLTNLGGDCGGRGGLARFTFSPFDDGHGFRHVAGIYDQSVAPGADSLGLLEDQHLETAEPKVASGMMLESPHRLLEEALEEMRLGERKSLTHLRLDQEVVRQLVAPVVIQIEPDNYTCFDKTNLEYQHAIEEDPHNPLLLSNFAQFLYIVRHDYDRSELYFHRALREDPSDGDVLGRYATFLWLGRKDSDAAERAFKAALASNPDNPYYSGSYAHFLWHSGDDGTACPVS